MTLLSAPEAILTLDGGMMELADAGDLATAEFVLHRLTEQFGATVKERCYRNLFGDLEREREYWWLDIRGHRYMLLRATAPADLLEVLAAGKQLTYDPDEYEAGAITLVPLRELRLERFPVESCSLPAYKQDPHYPDVKS